MSIHQHSIPERLVNLVGKKFGRLTVIEPVWDNKRGRHLCSCECECGSIKSVNVNELTRTDGKGIQSCGCFRREKVYRVGQPRGNNQHREFYIYHAMLRRCTNPTDSEYRNYGGRGITVCDRWTNSFEAFFEDMGKRPTPKHTIERINNDLGYSPENCRWATRSENYRNKRDNHLLTFDGKTLTVAEWSEITGFSHSMITRRLLRGWTVRDALTKPSIKK